MTDIEGRLKEALEASVADAVPGFDVVAAVRRRRRRHLFRAAAASAAAVAALGTTAALVGARVGSAGTAPIGAAAASAVAGLPCNATTATPAKPLPAAFRPVAVVRCYPQARGITGRGLWRFEVKQ